MFCTQCGTEMQAEARFCQSCGDPAEQAGAIWNPHAAANWSLVFSPAFGAYLQMLNWRALGETEKAAGAQKWFYASLAMGLVYVVVGMLMGDANAASAAGRLLGFIYLLVWYFSTGRVQGKYVKEKFGNNYAHKPWGKALLIGVAALAGYFLLAVIVGAVFGAVAGASSADPAAM